MNSLNCKHAKKISIVSYLKGIGHDPVRAKNHINWYYSPFRQEKTPSFKVDEKLNAWYDFGEGSGGNIIDLGVRIHNCPVADFLQHLAGAQTLTSNVPVPKDQYSKIGTIKIMGTAALTDIHLLAYLKTRCIDLSIARIYCCRVNFSLYNKSYYAVGFENRSGGYELRNAFAKLSSSPKDISLIECGSANLKVLKDS